MAPRQQQANGNGITPAQANMLARQTIVSQAVKRTQKIFSETVDLSQQNVINIPPRNVGLILGFLVNVRQNIAVAASTGTVLTRTPFGPANLVKTFTFFDLNNNTRIQTTGWHTHLVNSARAERPYTGVFDLIEMPVAYGKKFRSLMDAPASIAQAANANIAATYYVPLAYSEQDLRGSIYAGVVNATMNLQITLNNNGVGARTLNNWSDSVYCTANDSTPPADVTEGNVTVEVYQVYYDQLPRTQNGIVLPLLDLSTIYELKNTSVQGITPNQDYPIPYSNFRDFLSTFAIYRNRVNATTSPDTYGFQNIGDISRWKLESANYTNVFDVQERIAALWGRQTLMTDLPLGVYYFPTRSKPISTQQFGNMNLVIDASNVQTGAAMLVGYEAFALTNVVAQAQGLAPA